MQNVQRKKYLKTTKKTNSRRLHLAFTNAVANPFYVPGQKITSKKFDGVVRSLLGLREQ